MLRSLILISGLFVVFFGCKKEEDRPGSGEPLYNNYQASPGFAVNWHLTAYSLNDTSVRIAINDTVRFQTDHQCFWNDTINGMYYNGHVQSTGKNWLRIYYSPYGQLQCNSFVYYSSAAGYDPVALPFARNQSTDTCYFWGHRFP